MKTLANYIYLHKNRILTLLIACLFSLSFVDCAKRGRPSGGKRDSLAPVIVKSSPENYSTNFEGDEIRITFDEYIKLVDIQKNLIVSPPLKYQPIITPLSTSKQLRIQIVDTLRENTTYSFNFGKSIVDNNEGNEYPYFKYVFSTGSYIDSLTLSGKISDALLPKAENPVSVLLYEYDDAFNDSIVLKQKPTYITVTQDSSNTYQFSNLKEGKYLLVALKEKNNDYIFQPTKDKIAFYNDTISLPTDSTYAITLFKELPDFELTRPSHESKNEILFGFRGNIDSLKLKVQSETPERFTSKIFRDAEKDTLHYWFKPAFDSEVTDSLLFMATNRTQIDTLEVRLKNLFADSLKVSLVSPGTLTPIDTFKLGINTPIETISAEQIQIMDADSVTVPFTVRVDERYNQAQILFDRKFEQRYTLNLYPNAITDFFGASHDTLSFRARTLAEDDYGTMLLTVRNGKQFPIIVELVDERFKFLRSKKLTSNGTVTFDFIEPGFYYYRLVFDENNNGVWDTGNYLRRTQPERILYYPRKIEVNANWNVPETFTLE